MTKRRHNLIDTVPPGPKAWREAGKLRDRFLLEIGEKRNPRTSATVDQQHWSRHEHACDRRCTRPHVCRPLGASAVRHVHFLLSGAFERAVRWRWVGINPVTMASPPAAPRPNPQPPSPREAARIGEESWKEGPDWGALIWTAMTTGARRGEEGRETLWLRRAIARSTACSSRRS